MKDKWQINDAVSKRLQKFRKEFSGARYRNQK